MQILVVGEHIRILKVDPTESVSSLNKQICNEFGIAPDDQIISFQGKQIVGSLSDCKVEEGATVMLSSRLRGGKDTPGGELETEGLSMDLYADGSRGDRDMESFALAEAQEYSLPEDIDLSPSKLPETGLKPGEIVTADSMLCDFMALSRPTTPSQMPDLIQKMKQASTSTDMNPPSTMWPSNLPTQLRTPQPNVELFTRASADSTDVESTTEPDESSLYSTASSSRSAKSPGARLSAKSSPFSRTGSSGKKESLPDRHLPPAPPPYCFPMAPVYPFQFGYAPAHPSFFQVPPVMQQRRAKGVAYDLEYVDDKLKRRLLKNRQSAERSRQKKNELMKSLEEQLNHSQTECEDLKKETEQLRTYTTDLEKQLEAMRTAMESNGIHVVET